MNSGGEHELLSRLRASDYDAYTELYERFWKELYIHSVKKTGDKEDAFDLVQDLFMELWDKREKLPEIRAPLKFYLRGALAFKLARYFRMKGFRRQHEQDFEMFLQASQSPGHLENMLETQQEELQHQELIELVYVAIEGMPEKMKRIFMMSRSGQYSISQIAELLELSPQTVKNQVSNALDRIRSAAADARLTPGGRLALLAWLMIY